MTREQKITLGEMRSSGVWGLLIYCGDYKCAHSIESTPIDGRTMFGCPIWSPYSSARLAAIAARMSGRTLMQRSRGRSLPVRKARQREPAGGLVAHVGRPDAERPETASSLTAPEGWGA